MRTLLVFVIVVVTVSFAAQDLLSMLKQIHNSHSYQQLPSEEKVLIVELTSELAAGQLKSYIATVGIEKVFALLAHLPNDEEVQFIEALNKELQKEAHHTV